MRPNLIARRSFHTEAPCTISAKAAISGATSAGARKWSHIAAATMPKAKPARPVTKAAANVPAENKARSRACRPSIPHPIAFRDAHGHRGDRATLGQLRLRGGCRRPTEIIIQAGRGVNYVTWLKRFDIRRPP